MTTPVNTSAEAVERRCKMLRLLELGLTAQFPRDARFVGMFETDIATMQALLAENARLRTAVEALAKAIAKLLPPEREA